MQDQSIETREISELSDEAWAPVRGHDNLAA